MNKPTCKLIGKDGNIFNLLGVAMATLNEFGFAEKTQEMIDRVTSSGSHDEVLSIIAEYVDII